MRSLVLLSLLFICLSCKTSEEKKPQVSDNNSNSDISTIYDEEKMNFQVLDSKYLKASEIWSVFDKELKDFSEKEYNLLKPLILEQNIPTLQKHIQDHKLSYETLTKFFLYRIKTFDRENELSLNSVIALNPNVLAEARQKDKELLNKSKKHPIFGISILLKDNINTKDMPTTSGAVALQNNNTSDDAYVTNRLRENGALILGKANLSEWAFYFCGDCPSGYSAIGGQTFNPYGRKTIDVGGSSSGSAASVAANFCVAAVGSETAGSILNPASQNSVVGLKPTIGLLSRSGIIPISSSLDTPGPISKNVTDNAILLDAMMGYDETDFKAISTNLKSVPYYQNLSKEALKSKRFGAFKSLMEDPLYVKAIKVLKSQGAEIIEIEEVSEGTIQFPNLIKLLNIDMKADVANYFSNYGNKQLSFKSIDDIISYNKTDSINFMPYGQNLLNGVSADSATEAAMDSIKMQLKSNGRHFFDAPMQAQNLVGILSISNYHAAEAAVAEYPAITVPMGYTTEDVPEGLTFIAAPLSEKQLLEWAYSYEQASKMRETPAPYN